MKTIAGIEFDENKPYISISERRTKRPNWHAIVKPHPTDPDLVQVLCGISGGKEHGESFIKQHLGEDSGFIYI